MKFDKLNNDEKKMLIKYLKNKFPHYYPNINIHIRDLEILEYINTIVKDPEIDMFIRGYEKFLKEFDEKEKPFIVKIKQINKEIEKIIKKYYYENEISNELDRLSESEYTYDFIDFIKNSEKIPISALNKHIKLTNQEIQYLKEYMSDEADSDASEDSQDLAQLYILKQLLSALERKKKEMENLERLDVLKTKLPEDLVDDHIKKYLKYSTKLSKRKTKKTKKKTNKKHK